MSIYTRGIYTPTVYSYVCTISFNRVSKTGATGTVQFSVFDKPSTINSSLMG